MRGGEHPLLPLLQLPSLYPQHVWGPTASLVPQGGNSQLLGLTPFAIISLLIYSYLDTPRSGGNVFLRLFPPLLQGQKHPKGCALLGEEGNTPNEYRGLSQAGLPPLQPEGCTPSVVAARQEGFSPIGSKWPCPTPM